MSALTGRILQIAGMVILPIGLYLGMARGEVQTEVRLLAIGGLLYVTGWMISRKSEE